MKQGSHFKNNAVGFNQGNFEQNFRSGQTFNNGSDVNQNSFVVHQTNFDENVATDRSERTRNYQVTVELQRYAKDEQYETQKQQDNAKDEQYKKEEDYVMGLFAWRMIRAVVIFLYVGFRWVNISLKASLKSCDEKKQDSLYCELSHIIHKGPKTFCMRFLCSYFTSIIVIIANSSFK